MYKKNLLEFYDVLYENELDENMPHCPKCNSFLIESKIVDYKEIKEFKRYYKLGVAIDNNKQLIINDGMTLLGITIEGTDYDGCKEMIELPLSEENFKKIYDQAKVYWDKGYLSKYAICFMNTLDRCFQYFRPDMTNFEEMISFDKLISEDFLDENEVYYDKNFLLSKTSEFFASKYEIDEIVTDTDLELTKENSDKEVDAY